MNNKKLENITLAIVSPVYRGEKMVSELVRRIVENVETITSDYEIILVNDDSPDNSWKEIEKECAKNTKVKGINLSRNFGQHYAITAGLNYVKGEWVVVMDCDLQDRPEEIPNLYKKAQNGYDIVYARRVERKDKWFKRKTSEMFNSVLNKLSGLNKDKDVANYGIYNYKVIREYNKIPEESRSFASLILYLGFKSTIIDVQHSERYEGKSSYTLYRMLKLAFDVIISNSNKPLHLTVAMGIFMSIFSFLLAIYNIIARLTNIISFPGYTTTVFSIWFVGGIMLFVMGIIGLYIGKIFDQVKGRPIYIVRDTINIE